MDERERPSVQALPILCQPAAAVQPSNRTLDDPAFRQDSEAPRGIRPLDDLHLSLARDLGQPGLELRACVAAISIELEQERIQAEQRRHQQHAAVPVLDVGGVHDGRHQQALRVHEDVALLAADLLACVVARRVDAGPPFSAPFTLWLSMMQAVGLASRPACSRHRT